MPRPRQFDEEEVLQRAMELFWKQGYRGTSMDELVKYLGISRASLYTNFRSKEELFRRVIKRYQRQNLDMMRKFLVKQPSPWQGLRQLMQVSLQESTNDPDRKGCFVVNTVAELSSHQGEIVAWLLDHQQYFEAIYAEQIRLAQAAGEIPPEADAKLAASYLFTLYCGLKVVSRYHPEEAQLAQVIEMGLASIRSAPPSAE
jgi:TetR/AcrR family transcriptional regulator, transcriptional repressor for nem operon